MKNHNFFRQPEASFIGKLVNNEKITPNAFKIKVLGAILVVSYPVSLETYMANDEQRRYPLAIEI